MKVEYPLQKREENGFSDRLEFTLFLRDPFCYDDSMNRQNSSTTIDKSLHEKHIPRKGLILEGGAMRGMFTAGVLDVLMENDIPFDGAAGISAGAVFGCNIKSGQIGRAIRYNKKYGRDPRYCSLTQPRIHH